MNNGAIYLGIALAVLAALELFLVWRRKKKFSEKDRRFIAKEWNDIRAYIQSNPKHAVMEADKLLDFVLKKRGFSGTLAEKLVKAKLRHAEEVWFAHKLRNRVVHEVGFELLPQEVQRALSAYKRSLYELGISL